MAKTSLLHSLLTATALAVSLHLLAAADAGAANRQVGVAAGTTTKALGTPPDEDTRLLGTGTKMFFEENVVTDPSGRAQFLFEDGSSLTVGPRSDLVIDRFVYDPDTRTGEMAVSLTKGIVRFVGGRISKKRAVQFKTPVATMGIRGGVAVISLEQDGALEVDFLFGQELTLEVDGVVQTTTTPGTFISVAGPGAAPAQPQRRTAAALSRRMRAFEATAAQVEDDTGTSGSAGGQQAGAATTGPQVAALSGRIEQETEGFSEAEQQVEDSQSVQFESAGDVDVGTQIQEVVGDLDTPSPRPEEDNPEDFVEVATDTPTTDTPTTDTPTTETPTTPDTSAVAFSRTYSGFALRGNDQNGVRGANVTTSLGALQNRRFTSATASGDDSSVGGQLVASAPVGGYTLFFPGSDFASPTEIASCPSNLDCSTKVAGELRTDVTGPIQHDHDPDFIAYTLNVGTEKELVFTGNAYTGARPSVGGTRYSLQTDPFFADDLPFARTNDSGLATGVTVDAYAFWESDSSSKPFVSASFEIDQSSGASVSSVLVGHVENESSPYIVGFGYGAVDSTGTSHPSLYKGGMFSAETDGGKDFFGSSSPDYFVLNSVEDGDTGGSLSGVSNLDGSDTYYPVTIATKAEELDGSPDFTKFKDKPSEVISYTGGAGTVAGTADSFVTSSSTGSVSLISVSSSDTIDANISVVNSSGATISAATSGGTSAYIEDTIFATQLISSNYSSGTTETNTVGVLASAGNNTSNFTLCAQCEFLRWGFWSLQMDDNDVAIHMAAFVSGIATDVGTLANITGTASYSGNVIGSVIDSGALAVKTGSFAADVNFAGSDSTISLSNFSFDGGNFSSSAAFDPTSANAFAITGADGSKVLEVRGSFFGVDTATPNNVPADIGGDFSISGSDYHAAGVFAGHGFASN